MINKVVTVSGESLRDSAIHVQVPILPQTPFPPRLVHNSVEFHVLYNRSFLSIILNIAVCTSPSQTPYLFSPAAISSCFKFCESVSIL